MNRNIYWLFAIGIVATALLTATVSFVLFQQYYHPAAATQTPPYRPQLTHYEPAPVNISPSAMDVPESFSTTAEKVTAGVVYISTTSGRYRASSGSGVVISDDGYIITNRHVIENGERVTVTFNNKREVSAAVIGTDENTDVALLKVDVEGLSPIKFADSDRVKVGDWVLAVGNPFNLASTVTAGIVSAKARNINIIGGQYSIESFIQTDAVVNPGNSGGALVNASGHLVGINTAILSETGSYEGYSFAIPSNLVLKIVTDLREFGRVQRAILGVSIADIDDGLAKQLDLPSLDGVFVREVYAKTTAADAGLRSGDVIVSIDGRPTKSLPQLQEIVAQYRPGDLVSLAFIRNGKRYKRNDLRLRAMK